MPVEFTPDQIGRKYDDLAPIYDRFDVLAELSVLRRFRRSWFRRAEGDVLEVAAGTGRNLQYYPRDCRITAIDVSDGMLSRARKRAERLDLDVRCAAPDRGCSNRAGGALTGSSGNVNHRVAY